MEEGSSGHDTTHSEGEPQHIVVQLSDDMIIDPSQEPNLRFSEETLEDVRSGRAVIYRVSDGGDLWLVDNELGTAVAIEQVAEYVQEEVELETVESNIGALSGNLRVDEVVVPSSSPAENEVSTEYITVSQTDDVNEIVQCGEISTSLSVTCSESCIAPPTTVGSYTSVQTSESDPQNISASDAKQQSIAEICDTANSHQCTKCNLTFTKAGELKKHLRVHTGERPYTCNLCGVSFRQNACLKVHMRKHSGKTLFSCAECGKGFYDPANFKVHVHTHSEERNYHCRTCDKSFNAASTLHAHEKLHTGLKPYVCHFCSKAFAFNTNLVRHIRTHTGEKPYECNGCKAVFSNSSNLNCHKKKYCSARIPIIKDSTDGEGQSSTMYKCPLCPLKFHTKFGLRTHSLNHAKEGAVLCQHCCKAFEDTHSCNLHECKGGTHVCSQCSASLTTQEGLDHHYRTMHPEYQPKPSKKVQAKNQFITNEKRTLSETTNERLENENTGGTEDKVKQEQSECQSTETQVVVKNKDPSHLSAEPTKKKKIRLDEATNAATFKCSDCNKVFTDEGIYQAHKRTHNISNGITVRYTLTVTSTEE